MKYYAFEYWGGESTTTGEPNPRTGRMSIAGDLVIFSDKEQRDMWMLKENNNRPRKIVSSKKARELCAGMSLSAYNDMIENTIDDYVEFY